VSGRAQAVVTFPCPRRSFEEWQTLRNALSDYGFTYAMDIRHAGFPSVQYQHLYVMILNNGFATQANSRSSRGHYLGSWREFVEQAGLWRLACTHG
jgi:hypothetical protein